MLAIAGGFAIAFYVVVLPGFWAWVLIKLGGRGRRIQDAQYTARYGFLYKRYKRRFFWFELANLLRMLIFILIIQTPLWHSVELQVPLYSYCYVVMAYVVMVM